MTNTKMIGKFSDHEIRGIQGQVGQLLNGSPGCHNSNLTQVGNAAYEKLWELLDGRLTSEQLFALERILAVKWGGHEVQARLNFENGRIKFNSFLFPVELDWFIEALRLVVAPFGSDDRWGDVPTQLAALGLRKETT